MKKPEDLKIMHFHFGRDGGAERFFVNFVNGLARRGVQQKTVMRPNRIWRPMVEDATDIIESHFRNLSIDRLLLPAQMRKLNAQWQPDAMIAWTPKGCRLMAGTKHGMRIARLADYPQSLKRLWGVDVLVPIAPDMTKRVESLGWTKQTELISNFTSMETVAPISRAELEVPPDAFLIVAMGRFVKRKGFDTLLRALAKLPKAHLVLVGAGEERQPLVDLAASLGVSDRLRLTGWVKDSRPYMAACDVFAFPSTHEPLGNVALEAWAQGRPMVATRAEGPSWYIKDGENGLLVDIGDADGLAASLQLLLDDPSLRKKLSEGGTKTLEIEFSEKAIIDRYIAMIGSFKGR